MPDREGSRAVFLGVKLELDRTAFDVPIVDGQTNLAAKARVVPSSVRNGWGVEELFDDLGDTAWDPDGDDLTSSLDFELGKAQVVGAVSFSQRRQRLGWHQYYRYEVKARNSESEPWQRIYQGHSCLGGIPVLELAPVRARYLRLEIVKPRKTAPVQLAELRIFAAVR